MNLEIIIFEKGSKDCEALAMLVKSIHKSISVVSSRKELLLGLTQRVPKIVILDLSIHGMDGVEIVKSVRSDYPHVYLLLIADPAEPAFLIEGLRAGAVDFVSKPLLKEDLRNALLKVRAAIARRENRKFSFDIIKDAELRFVLNSSSKAIPPMVQFVKSLLHGFIHEREIMRIGLALDEVLHNAYEHGNLGITSAQKKQACDHGSFDELLKQREEKALVDGLVLTVQLVLRDNRFICTIEDEGPGFDWQKATANCEPESQSTDLYGRGVGVISKIFDEVTYLGKGNKIVLTKLLTSQ